MGLSREVCITHLSVSSTNIHGPLFQTTEMLIFIYTNEHKKHLTGGLNEKNLSILYWDTCRYEFVGLWLQYNADE